MEDATHQPPLVLFRVDAALHIGTGHVMRCLSLALELRRREVEVHFICRDHPGHLFSMIEKDLGFTLHHLPKPTEPNTIFDELFENENWLRTSWNQDARDCQQVLEGLDRKPDWLIVDHYALDQRWESLLRPYAKDIMVIDDLFTRSHDCDVLLNQSVLEITDQYQALVPNTTQLIIGPKFSLLNDQYAKTRAQHHRHIKDVENVLVFFGGVDYDNVSLRALQVLMQSSKAKSQIDIVLGSSNIHQESIREFAVQFPNIHVHSQLKDLSHLMQKADLAIGAGGTTTWERCCLGLPSIVVAVASNQVDCSQKLAEHGYIYYLCELKNFTSERLRYAIEAFDNPQLRTFVSASSMRLVDGQGCRRVAAALFPTMGIHIRRANLDDARKIFDWRNSEEVRKYSINPEILDYSKHIQWYSKSLQNENRVLLIGEIQGRAIGVVRYDLDESLLKSEISIFLDPKTLHKGCGSALLSTADVWLKKKYPSVKHIHAKVLPRNLSSLFMFRNQGYKEILREYVKEL